METDNNLSPELIDQMPLAVMLVDQHGAVRYANAACSGLFHQSVEALAKKNLRDFLPGQVLDNSGGGGPRLLSVDFQDAPGQAIQFSTATVRYDGAPCHLLTAQDGGHWQQAQVGRGRAEKQREAAERALQEMPAVLNDEFQAPLRSILSFCQLLRSDCEIADDSTEAEYLNYVETAAQGMDKVTRMLMRLFKRGQPPERVAPASIVTKVCARLSEKMDALHAQVDCEGLPDVHVDPMGLTEVFQALIENSLRYIRPGETPKIRIFSRAEQEGWATICVQDQGPGFDSGEMDYVFELFARGAAGEAYTGRGLGLALCRAVVSRHGGRIWAENVATGGALVAFCLPLPQGLDLAPRLDGLGEEQD